MTAQESEWLDTHRDAFENDIADLAVTAAQHHRAENRAMRRILDRLGKDLAVCRADPAWRACHAAIGSAENWLRIVAQTMREMGYRMTREQAAVFLWDKYADALAYEAECGMDARAEAAALEVRASLANADTYKRTEDENPFAGLSGILARVYDGIDLARLPRRYCILDRDFDAGALCVAFNAAHADFGGAA